MIKSHKQNVNEQKLCFNCNRLMRGTIKLDLDSFTLVACEDCANALSNVIRTTLTDDVTAQYDEDEYSTIID